MDNESFRIFIFGLCILFGWMAVIVICASPQLFRDLLKRYLCCWFVDVEEKKNKEKIKIATARMLTARQSIMVSGIAGKPTEIMIGHAMGQIHTIDEESRAGTVAPEDGDEADAEITALRPSIS
ncbi:unnamed protein product, partial [Mesorhabditis belari]|uniref:Uncharacterized protein n=1 Tax=Mesorhabditis belari TaxID=2138241 RepID=A0AAF3EW63_9BILA